jgi:hypothetical protein
MSDDIDFRLFKYILAVAEEENITKAADRLFLAQPSLSKQIKDLEDDIEIPLFFRNRGGAWPTPAGEIIVAYARDALLIRAETLAMARAVHEERYPLSGLDFHPSSSRDFFKCSVNHMLACFHGARFNWLEAIRQTLFIVLSTELWTRHFFPCR